MNIASSNSNLSTDVFAAIPFLLNIYCFPIFTGHGLELISGRWGFG